MKKKPRQKTFFEKMKAVEDAKFASPTVGMRKDDGTNTRYVRSKCCMAPWIIAIKEGVSELRCMNCSKVAGPNVHIHIKGQHEKMACDCCEKKPKLESVDADTDDVKKEIKVAVRVRCDDDDDDAGKLSIEGGITGGGDKTMILSTVGLMETLKDELLSQLRKNIEKE